MGCDRTNLGVGMCFLGKNVLQEEDCINRMDNERKNSVVDLETELKQKNDL